jgi:hypothetical protein
MPGTQAPRASLRLIEKHRTIFKQEQKFATSTLETLPMVQAEISNLLSALKLTVDFQFHESQLT